jgi:hypothetical protein
VALKQGVPVIRRDTHARETTHLAFRRL